VFFVLTTLTLGKSEGLFFNLASAILVRSFALPGLFAAQYQYFFSHFSYTYLSHVHGVNLIVTSPYSMPLGMEIANFFAGASSAGRVADCNANFFVFDGIAGFGLPGVPIIGALCAAMFWVLDSCSKNYPLAFATSALTMCIVSLANSSLFTTFLGGGIMMWMILFLCMPKDLVENVSSTESS
jgi:hypothetical protein